jgi:predicted GNAT family N-acyltransferase
MDFVELTAEEVRPLRTRILRSHVPEDEMAVFEGDEAPTSRHYGLRESGEALRAVVTYLRRESPDDLAEPAVRLRGMAVDEGYRRRGLGRRLLQSSLTHLAVHQPDLEIVWCHARTSAAEFYEREGFERHGDAFEVEKIGPHVAMWREIPQAVVGREQA